MKTSLETLGSMNPATGEVVGEVPITPVDRIPQLVHDARKAQVGWGAIPLEERAKILIEAGKCLEEDAERIGGILTAEMGKPLAEGIGEANYAASSIAEEVEEIIAAITPEILEDDATTTTMRFDPFGVVAAITPWDFPILMPHHAVIPGLMAGNSEIL